VTSLRSIASGFFRMSLNKLLLPADLADVNSVSNSFEH